MRRVRAKGRTLWRVQVAPPGAVGMPRLVLHALRSAGRDALVIADDSAPAQAPAVTVVPVSTGTKGMAARLRWTRSPDGSTLLAMEDPASVENEPLPNGFAMASEDGRIARRDSVWDVAPRPDWKAAAFGAASLRGAGERDSLSAEDWRVLSEASGLDEATVRRAAFPTSGMAVAMGVARPGIVELSPPGEGRGEARMLDVPGGWRVRWSRDGTLLALGAPPRMIADDAAAESWTLVDPASGRSRTSRSCGARGASIDARQSFVQDR